MVGAARLPDRFVLLDALRFFFALIVVMGHIFNFNRTLVHGAFAVDFFFILSVFVLSRMLIQSPMSWWDFTGARFARLYPLHFATFAWMLLQALGPRSISAAIACVSLSAGALVFTWGPVFDEATLQPLWLAVPVASGAFLRGAAAIPLGYLLYELYLVLRPRIDQVHYRRLATGFEIVVGGLLVYCLSSRRDVWDALAVPLSAMLILQMATCPGQVSALLQGRAFAALGNLSYSIYLLHIPLLAFAAGSGFLSPPGDHLTPRWLAYFGALLVLSALSFRYFERPAQQYLTRHLRSWRTRAAIP
jgi:peptidoglycan/LPS O-acetylase OafA/YrhL